MIKYGVITGSTGNIGDRYTPNGYKLSSSLEERLEGFSKIEHLKCIEISQDETKDLSAKELKSLMKLYNLEISAVGLDLTSEPFWKFGSITSKEVNIRKKAADKIKKTIDFSVELEVGMVNVWLGQDGFDYPFQVDYIDQWNFAVESIRECSDYNSNIKLALEPKPREPRNRSYLDTTTTALLLVRDIDRENVGVTIDVGHVLQDGKNMAQSIAYAHLQNKLFNLHINDNYSTWDDDMIVGSVHTIEFIELFYTLKKIGYSGYCSIDIFPFRENSIKATEESVQYMRLFEHLVDVIGIDKLDDCLKSDDVTKSIKLIRESIFK